MYLKMSNDYLAKKDYSTITIEPKIGSVTNYNNPTFIAINDSIYEFIKECDGTKTYEDIIEVMSERYIDVTREILRDDFDKVKDFFLEQEILAETKEYQVSSDIYREFIDSFVPTNVSLEVTNQCQLKCKHCLNSYDNIDSIESRFMSLERIKKLMGLCVTYNIQSVFITGGEPFLHPEIKKILEESCKNFNKVTIATNGFIIISDELCTSLSNYNTTVQISIDGNKDYHNLFRGNKLSYYNAYKNIDKLIAYGISVQISYTVNQRNFNFLEDEVIKAKKRGVTSFNIGSTSQLGNALENNIKPLNIYDFTQKSLELCKKYSNEHFAVGLECTMDELEVIINKNKENNKCGAGTKIVHVCSNFDVVPCPSMCDLKIGEDFDINFEKILKADNTLQYTLIQSPSRELCNGCTLDFQCGGCIGNMLEKVKNDECQIYQYSDLL